MSGPGLPKHRAVLAAVNTATRRYRGGLRPVLTAAARGAHPKLGRGGKTPPKPNRKTSQQKWPDHFAELDAHNCEVSSWRVALQVSGRPSRP
jgi:hypothetical protein